MSPWKKYLTYDDNFGVRTKVICIKIYPRFTTLDQFLLDLSNKYSDRQANFNMSDGNNINSGITGKIKPSNERKNLKIRTPLQKLRLNIHLYVYNYIYHYLSTYIYNKRIRVRICIGACVCLWMFAVTRKRCHAEQPNFIWRFWDTWMCALKFGFLNFFTSFYFF